MFTRAITRLPGKNIADGLTTADLGRPSYPLIIEQHQAYRQALHALGLEVIVLPEEPAFPDAYFVEDPAIVTPRLAVITRLGAPSRRGEGLTLEPVLGRYFTLAHIHSPGTVDGGDVLMVEDHFFIGLSARTNEPGAAQLATLLEGVGYTCEMIPVITGLHLKSSVNYIGQHTLIVTKALASSPAFGNYEKITVAEGEEYAANSLWVNGSLLVPRGFPTTRTKLASLGMDIIELDVSEVRKMDGGLTCMSLRF